MWYSKKYPTRLGGPKAANLIPVFQAVPSADETCKIGLRAGCFSRNEGYLKLTHASRRKGGAYMCVCHQRRAFVLFFRLSFRSSVCARKPFHVTETSDKHM